jgi:hypothetical protein
LRQWKLQRVEFGRAIFHEELRHNSLARPWGAHADLQNVSSQVQPKDARLTPLAWDPSMKPIRRLKCLSETGICWQWDWEKNLLLGFCLSVLSMMSLNLRLPNPPFPIVNNLLYIM